MDHVLQKPFLQYFTFRRDNNTLQSLFKERVVIVFVELLIKHSKHSQFQNIEHNILFVDSTILDRRLKEFQ